MYTAEAVRTFDGKIFGYVIKGWTGNPLFGITLLDVVSEETLEYQKSKILYGLNGSIIINGKGETV